ncbi:hypothetical protein CLOM_g18538 [Closterium sp. NIES-68]|nr:hypothetical protein CLOM_g18538 [Closterium sp. NIES-68]GJP64315.1 hypothetical protein CLOP_g21325 [Closterium sp. NIES-67]
MAAPESPSQRAEQIGAASGGVPSSAIAARHPPRAAPSLASLPIAAAPKLLPVSLRSPLYASLLLLPVLALLLLRQPLAVDLVAIRAAHEQSRLESRGEQHESPASHESQASHEQLQGRVDELLASWAAQLADSPTVAGDADGHRQSASPPPNVAAPPAVHVRAPHLADCAANARVYAEEHWASRPADGSDPPWAAIRHLAGEGEGEGEGGENEREKGGSSRRGVEGEGAAEGRRDEGREAGFEAVEEGPWVPWVEGGEWDNYPLTGRVQRDLWRHQFPRDCSHPAVRFLLAPLERSTRHGIGTQITLLAGALALAVRTNRVLVIARAEEPKGGKGRKRGSGGAGLVGGFDRAEHEGCEQEGMRGEWRCYFLGETSDECRRRAHALAMDPASFSGSDPLMAVTRRAEGERGDTPRGNEEEGGEGDDGGREAAGGRGRGRKGGMQKGGTRQLFFPVVPRRWGQPWLAIPGVVEAEGRLIAINRMNNTYRWWRAQAMRFFLRAPSPRLCRLLNAQRHLSFGRLAAAAVVEAELAVAEAERVVAGADMAVAGAAVSDGGSSTQGRGSVGEESEMEEGDKEETTDGEEDKMRGGESVRVGEGEGEEVHESEKGGGGGGGVQETGDGSDGGRNKSRLQQEVGGASASAALGPMEHLLWSRLPHPLVPRPLVSVHVRMGDKGREMRVAGVAEYVRLLQRVRTHHPHATFVWLATEMQPVVDQLTSIHGWTWFVTAVPRIAGNEGMPAYERALGVQRSTDNAFVNLLLALEGDYFIGALGSSWSFLIDALRCTGGKMRQGFLSVNVSPRW